MGFQLGGRELPDPTQQMEAGPVSGVGVHKRAYAKLAISGQTQFVTCGSNYSIESNVKGTHASMFSNESSTGRVAPKPSLESINVSNDGGQDMSDAMLFQADMTVKVYSSKDFDKLDIKDNLKAAIIIPDKDIIPGAETLNPAYIIFENYEKILNWNRSLRFALAVCTLKDKFKDEL